MVLAHEDEGEDKQHPYWYAKVLRIFHVNVRVLGNFDVVRMDFLWVHWFGQDPDHPSGFKKQGLHRMIGLFHSTSPASFGFLDPSDVLQAVHLIPAFSIGRTPKSLDLDARDEDETEWEFFYVSMYSNHFVFQCTHTDGGLGL
jgi:hypothetical protein